MPFDGGSGTSVTFTWTVNGQPASASSCGGDMTHVRVVVPRLDEVNGHVTYNTQRGSLLDRHVHVFQRGQRLLPNESSLQRNHERRSDRSAA